MGILGGKPDQCLRFPPVLSETGGRKRSIQLLEYFDRIGFTRRLATERRIRGDSALAIQLMGIKAEEGGSPSGIH